MPKQIMCSIFISNNPPRLILLIHSLVYQRRDSWVVDSTATCVMSSQLTNAFVFLLSWHMNFFYAVSFQYNHMYNQLYSISYFDRDIPVLHSESSTKRLDSLEAVEDDVVGSHLPLMSISWRASLVVWIKRGSSITSVHLMSISNLGM